MEYKKPILKNLASLLVIVALSWTTASAQTPVANFTATPLAGCSPLIVNFQDASTGNPTSWYWNFGNGNTSTLQHPAATYFTPGTYTITLTATNASGSNTLTRTDHITVYETPVVNFNASSINGCFPLRVQFTDNSTAGTGNINISWLWDFGNGTTSTLQNPFTIYNTAGIFTVTLRVTNDKGCVKTITRPNYITVASGVAAGFTNTQPTVCAAPANISFTNTSTGPPTLSYFWNFGDGNFSSAPNPVHTYTSNGSFIITLVTSSTAGCQDTVRNTIVVGGNINSFSAPVNACISEVVTFTNTSVPLPGSADWTFGDGGSATGINATHSYSATGTYNVWLYNNLSGCRDSVMQAITINPKPAANFTAPVRSGCQPPFTVNFQDSSSADAVGWLWDFGDGNSSVLQNPSHTYTAYGSFAVTLVTTNIYGCTSTVVKTNYIRIQRATMSIPGLQVKGCIPFTFSPVPVIISVDAITSYQWNFGDGGTSTLANPTYIYTTQGTYTLQLIITTSTGCTDTLTYRDTVRVGTKPVVDFSATPIPVCGRNPVNFTDLSSTGDEWLWDFGDGGHSALQNPVYSYSDTGYFSVSLIVTNNGCADTAIKINYTHVYPPIARFSSSLDCNNRLQFYFIDESIAPQTWLWNFGDGTTSALQHPVHTFPALGTYSVTLTVTNNGCTDVTTKSIYVVNEDPDITADRTIACKGTVINFTAGNILTPYIVGYQWDFGNGVQQNTTTPNSSTVYNSSGVYTVTLITIDINGCADTITKINYIRVNGPVAGFIASNVAGCTGLTTIFNDISVNDGINPIVNWQWDFGDGVVQNFTAPPFVHTYNTTGTFSVGLTTTDATGCTDYILHSNLITTVDPVPAFVSADTLTCPGGTVSFTNNSSPSGLSSTWDFGDGGVSLATSPTHIYTANGFYSVKLRVEHVNGCADSITRVSYIHVAQPIADFSISDSISSCTPFQIQFNNTSSFYSSVFWDFGPGQGNSTLNSPVHYYSTPGVYPVKLIVTNPGGCKDSIIKNIRVFDLIGSGIAYTPVSGCKPLATTLNAFTTGQMASYFWDFGDGYTMTSTTPDVSHIYTSPGNFLPKVIMKDPSGCQIPLQGNDTIFVTGAVAKFGIDNNAFCDIATVNFTDSSIHNDPIILYNWNFGDGGTSSQQHPVHQYNSPGNYTVQLVVQTQYGCRDTLSKPNLINIIQRPVIDIGGDTSICINASLLHSGIFIQPDTSAVSWSWSFPNGNTSSLQNPPAQTYKTAGTFIVTTVATNSSGCKDTTIQTIIVNPLPVATMPGQITLQTGFPVTIPATYSPNTVSWVWSPSLGLSCANCPTPEASPKFNTRYQVYFKDNNGCANIKAVDVIVICKNANLFIPNTFTPNGDGSNEMFYPRGKGLERVKMMRIFNRWGEVVYEKRDFPVNDAAAGWDGTFKGKRPIADIYVYQLEVFCDNGDIIRLNGNIALIL